MMYGEVRRGISEAHGVCGNTTSSSSERKRIRCFGTSRQRLAAGVRDLTRAIVPDAIIAREAVLCNGLIVNFMFLLTHKS